MTCPKSLDDVPARLGLVHLHCFHATVAEHGYIEALENRREQTSSPPLTVRGSVLHLGKAGQSKAGSQGSTDGSPPQKHWLPGHSAAVKPGRTLVPRAQHLTHLTHVGPGEDNAFLSPTSALLAVLTADRHAWLL